ncbi:hypothetical protein YC2023_100373 [Brassica napus]
MKQWNSRKRDEPLDAKTIRFSPLLSLGRSIVTFVFHVPELRTISPSIWTYIHESIRFLPNLSSVRAHFPSQQDNSSNIPLCFTLHQTVSHTSIQNFSQIGIQMNLPRALEVAVTEQLNLPDLSCCF